MARKRAPEPVDPLANIDAVLAAAMPGIEVEPEPDMPPPVIITEPAPPIEWAPEVHPIEPGCTLFAGEPEPEPPRELGPLEAAHLRDLTTVGKAETVEGLMVLTLARRLDSGVVDTALAGVARQLTSAAEAVYRGTSPNPDRLDELEVRRSARMTPPGQASAP